MQEITIVLAIVSPIAALVFGLTAMRRGQKADEVGQGREMGRLLSEVSYVKASVDNIARKLEANDERYIELTNRLSAVEQSAKTAHRRIDEITRKGD